MSLALRSSVVLLAGALAAPVQAQESQPSIPGYTFGSPSLGRSPLGVAELELLQKTVLLGPEDVAALRASKAVLADQTDAILDVWYGFVASQPHLVRYFSRRSDGQPDAAYLGAVRKRFARWFLDTADARFDQTWLDWQHELGRRHHRVAKNHTDRADSVEIVHFRYLPALIVPVTTTLKPFLAKKGASAEEVERMHAAWVKSVTLQVILWSHPYVREGDF